MMIVHEEKKHVFVNYYLYKYFFIVANQQSDLPFLCLSMMSVAQCLMFPLTRLIAIELTFPNHNHHLASSI